jgi:hypothetical protein
MILRIVSRGLTPDVYESLRARTDIDHKHPLGLIMHGASQTDGLMMVAQVWEEAQYAERFDEDILIPALEELELPLQADVKIFELRHLVTP